MAPLKFGQMVSTVVFGLFLSGNAAAQDQAPAAALAASDVITSLCSSGIEGTFQGQIDKTPSLINVVCIDSGRLAMGIEYGSTQNEVPITLINSLVDDDGTLVFSINPLDQADRRSATSGSPNMYARIDVNALKNGQLQGVYVGGNSVQERKLSAKKTASLPSLPSLHSIGISPKSARGTYKVKVPGMQPFLFWFDMVAGVPVVTVDDGNKGLHLIDGPTWDGTGGFAVSDVFGDFMPASFANLTQMRGYVGKLGQLQIYYIDPLHGVQGPFTAIRQ